jgi:hypothetical protein
MRFANHDGRLTLIAAATEANDFGTEPREGSP